MPAARGVLPGSLSRIRLSALAVLVLAGGARGERRTEPRDRERERRGAAEKRATTVQLRQGLRITNWWLAGFLLEGRERR